MTPPSNRNLRGLGMDTHNVRTIQRGQQPAMFHLVFLGCLAVLDSRVEQAGYLVDLKLFRLAVRRFWDLNNRFPPNSAQKGSIS